MTLRHRLTAELERHYRERTTERRCDCCGAASPTLIREPVEGVICERCPECRERGEVP